MIKRIRKYLWHRRTKKELQIAWTDYYKKASARFIDPGPGKQMSWDIFMNFAEHLKDAMIASNMTGYIITVEMQGWVKKTEI